MSGLGFSVLIRCVTLGGLFLSFLGSQVSSSVRYPWGFSPRVVLKIRSNIYDSLRMMSSNGGNRIRILLLTTWLLFREMLPKLGGLITEVGKFPDGDLHHSHSHARSEPDGDLHHSSWQRQTLNPLSKARGQAQVLPDTMRVLNPLSHNGNSQSTVEFRNNYSNSWPDLLSKLCLFSASSALIKESTRRGAPLFGWNNRRPDGWEPSACLHSAPLFLYSVSVDSPRLLSVLRPWVCSGAGWGEAEKVGHCPSLWHLPREQKYLQRWPDSNEFEEWGFWSYLSEFPQTKPFPENCCQHSRLSRSHWASRYGISLPSCPRSSVKRRANGDLLWSTGNSIWGSVVIRVGEESERGWACVRV